MSAATPADARQNIEVCRHLVQTESNAISAKVGLHALARLADMMPNEEFVEFVNGAIQIATTGQAPPEENEGAEGGQSQ